MGLGSLSSHPGILIADITNAYLGSQNAQCVWASEENVYVLADLALATTTCGWSRRLIVPRPTTVKRQRQEPRDLASIICCAPYLGEPLVPAVTFKVERVECSDEMFGQTPVFYSLDGWPEPFHLLDWLYLIFDQPPTHQGK